MHHETTIHVAAPVEAVWALTEDIEGWPSVTPTIKGVERLDAGPLRVGSRARVRQPAMPPAVWTVTALEPPHLFEWRTSTLGVTMTARHLLEPDASGCRTTLVLDLTGFAARPFDLLAGRQIQRAIETENRSFQERAESEAAGTAGAGADPAPS